MKNRDAGPESVLVALPVFNEGEHVDDVLQAVHRYAREILVVNDGSTDGTALLLRKHTYLHLITHETNLGYGRSLIDAFGYAQSHAFDWVITIDCDRQHEPSRIPLFYQRMRKNAWDIISGSRYLWKQDRRAPPPPERMAINRAITTLLNKHLNLSLTDAFCGFKAYRSRAVEKLALGEAGYGLPLQLWGQASRAHLRIHEIPVPLIYHDPRRSFAGELKDPGKRVEYYCAVIERELGYDIRGEMEELLRTNAGWGPLGSSGVAYLARVGACEPGPA